MNLANYIEDLTFRRVILSEISVRNKNSTSLKPRVTRCNLSRDLQCNSTLKRCKISKYASSLHFANVFFAYQISFTNQHLSRVELRCKLQEKLHRVTSPLDPHEIRTRATQVLTRKIVSCFVVLSMLP